MIPARLIAIAALLGACGGTAREARHAAGPDPSAGRELAASAGCASCHGTDGQGGIGPAWVGLFGSKVVLDDGSTVTADAGYLREAIADPSAKRVAGYGVQMRDNRLSPGEIADLVAFIETLAPAPS
jgi:cytochrome c oxidase subunit 2